MSRYSAIKKALAQVATENDNTGELRALRRTLLAQQEVPHYDTENGGEPFKHHKGPAVVHAWSGMKEDHNTFEEAMSGFGHSDTGYAGRGLYGGSKKAAQSYAEKPGRKLKNLTFKFKNPLVRTDENWKDPIMPYDWIPKRTLELEEQGLDWTSAKLRASGEYPQMLKEKGYDGFIDAVHPKEMGEIVAYHPETVEIHDNTVHGALVSEFIRMAADEKPRPSFMDKINQKLNENQPAVTPPAVTSQTTTPQPVTPTPEKKPQLSFMDKINQKVNEAPKVVPTTQTPKPAQNQPATSNQPAPTTKSLLSEEAQKHMQALKDAVQQRQQAQNTTELQQYIQGNPVPEKVQALVAQGNALVVMPKPGTPLDAMPVVPDGAYDEVADMTIEDVGAVSYPDGKPVYAAFGDKAEYEGILKAAGFKPKVVYFFPKPDAKNNSWRGAKHANMYVSVGTAGKDAVEAAWSNPNHPVAIAGRKEQMLIDSRREESERQRKKYQENIDRVQRTRQPYSAEGYNEENHRKSYAHTPHKITAIPTPKSMVPTKKQIEYLPYQMAAVSFINERLGGKDDAKPDAERGAILADSPGIGKAQPVDVPVLTPNGWKPIGEMKIGDEIFAGDGSITKITGVFPQGEKEVYRVTFTDNSSTECCDEHLWVVNTPYRIKNKLAARVKSLNQIRTQELVSAGKRQHYIPITTEVEFQYKELTIDPYLLGCLLGDGSITQRQILFSTKDEEIIQEIKNRMPNNMIVNSTDNRGCNFRIASTSKNNTLIQQLKDVGVWHCNSDNKFVPENYLMAHASARLEILQGLMDTDGTVLKHNSSQFTSNSKQLVQDVAFLVESLGGVCRVTNKISASGKVHYIATVKMNRCPFKLQRKAQKWLPHIKYPASRAMKEITYSRTTQCVCISVEHESKTYLTERCIVTHNTMPAIGVISTNPSIRRVLVVCPSVMVPVWIREMKKWLAGDHMRDPITTKLKVKVGRYKKDEELPDITVMSYESLSKASKDISNPERIGDRAWDYVILDESHRVKDEHSVQACVIMGGRPKRRKSENPLIPEVQTPGLSSNENEYPGVPSKRRLLLTGTPIPSYAWELYANLRFVRPDIFNNEDEFMYQFAVMKAFRTTMWKKNKQTGTPELHRLFITKPVRPQNMTLLNKLLFGGGTYRSGGQTKHFDGIIMRRIHKDLEALGDQYTWPPKGNAQYRAIVEDQDNTGLDARTTELSAIEHQIQEAKKRGASQDELAELEHEYNDKVKVSFQRVAKVRNAIGMRKAPYVAAEAALQARGSEEGRPNQVLVFAYHKNVIETIAAGIEQKFKSMGHPEWKVAIVYGATSDKKREETFEQFQNDPNVKVIVASYKVLKEGITLTAANKVIHAELMPNPIDYEQAYARAWRRGQDRQVSETYMWLPKTFDERLYAIASGKYAAANRILNHRLPVPEAA